MVNHVYKTRSIFGEESGPKNNVLLAIKPHWADAILSGDKKWEYRRVTINAEPGAKLFLYASGNVHAIVGEVTINKILNGPIESLIKHTVREVPETEEDLRKSFEGHMIGHAIKVINPTRFKTPITLATLRRKIPQFVPPQGFYYIRNGSPLFELLRTSNY